MSAVRKTSLSDPLSLDGLEPLLDQIFGVQYEFAPDTRTSAPIDNSNIPTASTESKIPTAHVDFYSVEANPDDRRNQLLTKQLTEIKAELKAFQYEYRYLQLKLAANEDQLQYLPELFSKVLTVSGIQAENAELKLENAALLRAIENMKPKVNQPSMGRRILNRFFGT
jgi:hypothetical protein